MAKFFEIGHFQFFEIGHEMANLATLAMNKAQNPAFLSAIKEQKVWALTLLLFSGYSPIPGIRYASVLFKTQSKDLY